MPFPFILAGVAAAAALYGISKASESSSSSSERVVRSDEAEQREAARRRERERVRQAAWDQYQAFQVEQCQAFVRGIGRPFVASEFQGGADPEPLLRAAVDAHCEALKTPPKDDQEHLQRLDGLLVRLDKLAGTVSRKQEG